MKRYDGYYTLTLSSDMDEGTCVLFCLAFKSNLLCILSNPYAERKERWSWDYFDDTHLQKLMSNWKTHTHTQAWWLCLLLTLFFLASLIKVC